MIFVVQSVCRVRQYYTFSLVIGIVSQSRHTSYKVDINRSCLEQQPKVQNESPNIVPTMKVGKITVIWRYELLLLAESYPQY